MTRRRPLITAVGLLVASSCGGGGSAECLQSDAGQVCAASSSGSIQFSGSGLRPDSAVLIQHPELGLSVYEVADDGTFEPNGGGVVSLIVDTPFTFAITATDSDGELIEGNIELAT